MEPRQRIALAIAAGISAGALLYFAYFFLILAAATPDYNAHPFFRTVGAIVVVLEAAQIILLAAIYREVSK